MNTFYNLTFEDENLFSENGHLGFADLSNFDSTHEWIQNILLRAFSGEEEFNIFSKISSDVSNHRSIPPKVPLTCPTESLSSLPNIPNVTNMTKATQTKSVRSAGVSRNSQISLKGQLSKSSTVGSFHQLLTRQYETRQEKGGSILRNIFMSSIQYRVRREYFYRIIYT
jgi:hypothetical protein